MENPKRTERVALALTPDEYTALVAHARSAPPAVIARQIILDAIAFEVDQYTAAREEDMGIL